MRGNAVLCAIATAIAILCAPNAAAQAPRPQPPQLQAPAQQLPNRELRVQSADPELPIYILQFPDSPPNIRAPGDQNAGAQEFSERDHDRDGHASLRVGGDDCDDADARRAPGRPEVGDYEGHDEDCNFETIGTLDEDHDGFTSWRVAQVWRTAGGRPYAILRGPDCDDRRRDVNPGTPEVLGDHLDNNCDGAIDVVARPGDGDYCAPATMTRLSQMGVACAAATGDTRRN